MRKIIIIAAGAGHRIEALLSKLAQQYPKIKNFIIMEHPPDEFIPEKVQKSLESMNIEERIIDTLEIRETDYQIKEILHKDNLRENFFKHFKVKIPEKPNFVKNPKTRIRNNLH